MSDRRRSTTSNTSDRSVKRRPRSQEGSPSRHNCKDHQGSKRTIKSSPVRKPNKSERLIKEISADSSSRNVKKSPVSVPKQTRNVRQNKNNSEKSQESKNVSKAVLCSEIKYDTCESNGLRYLDSECLQQGHIDNEGCQITSSETSKYLDESNNIVASRDSLKNVVISKMDSSIERISDVPSDGGGAELGPHEFGDACIIPGQVDDGCRVRSISGCSSDGEQNRVVFLVGSMGQSSSEGVGSYENPPEIHIKHPSVSEDLSENQEVISADFPSSGLSDAAGTEDGYQRLIADDDSTAMSSSMVCTDGSDVEVLSDDDDEANGNEKESSDSIEVLESDRPALKPNTLRVRDFETDGDSSAGYTEDSSPESVTKTEDPHSLETGMDTDQEELLGAAAHIEAVVQIYNRNEEKKMGIAQEVDASLWEGAVGGQNTNVYRDVLSKQRAHSLPHSSSGGMSSDDGMSYEDLTDLQMTNGSIHRPDSLSLPRPLQYYERKRLARQESGSSTQSDMYSHHSSTEALIEAVTSTPLHAQGTVMKEGDMMSFVAEDLAEKIRISSPPIRIGDHSGSGSWTGSRTPSGRSVSSVASIASSTSGWSTSSASGWSAFSNSGMSSRSPSVVTQSPEDIPPIDPMALRELENHARRVADSLDHMMGNLNSSLHKMSSLTGACLDTYKESIDHTCDSVDASIKSMYALMAKCEELSMRMKPVYELADQVKEIKRLLDLFEAQMSREEK